MGAANETILTVAIFVEILGRRRERGEGKEEKGKRRKKRKGGEREGKREGER